MTSPEQPTFYDSRPSGSFSPSPNIEPDSHPAPSVISSRMTDIASEDGDRSVQEVVPPIQPIHNRVSVGDSILNHSRPPSAAQNSSQRDTWSQPPPSRRGLPPGGGIGLRGGVMMSGTGRPASAMTRSHSVSSRTSRTHVPSLTSHAFFRPMSSQRLQAQRGVRPSATGEFMMGGDGVNEAVNGVNRQSVGSTHTFRQGPLIHQDPEIPPPSRGTDYTEPDVPDRATANTSPTGHGTVQSMTESLRPLQNRSPNMRPTHPDPNNNYKQGHNMLAPPSKSPKSFRSSFLLPAKSDGPPSNATQGRERLSSGASSPRSPRAKLQEEVRQENGRNYQYYSGNTVFCMGGRLQNARDRPINIATGIFVALPGALFFAYS